MADQINNPLEPSQQPSNSPNPNPNDPLISSSQDSQQKTDPMSSSMMPDANQDSVSGQQKRETVTEKIDMDPANITKPQEAQGVSVTDKPDVDNSLAGSDQGGTTGMQPDSAPKPVSDMAKPVQPPAVAPGTNEKLDTLKPDLEAGSKKFEDNQVPAQNPQSNIPEGQSKVSDEALSGMQGDESIPEGNASASVPPVSNIAKPPAQQVNSDTESGSDQTSVSPQNIVNPTTSSPDENLKKTHEPIFVMPDRLEMGQVVNLKVKVGMIPHVMEEAHHIQSIELYANDKLINKVELNPNDNKVPEADFQVALAKGMQLKAVAYCNVHGKWESTKTI